MARGDSHSRAAPSAIETVTVLFTDLCGSTGLASRIGPAAAEELRREHFAVLREAVDETGGREVKNVGDGLMVVFASAARAVDCAVAMQQLMDRRNQEAEEQLLIRVGVSLGDAERDDDDYFGLPVIEAARLCDKAAGGQILTGDLVRAMVGARGEHSFTPVGELELKGLPAPVAAHQVDWEPLGADPSVIPLPTRLAEVPPVAYVGRVGEREQLARLWADTAAGRRRVALLSGEPGIGKTRLSTHTALEAHANGATVLYGRCTEDIGMAYGPWVEALRHFVKHAPVELLEQHVEAYGAEVGRLVRELGLRVPSAPPPRESDPETERYLLWRAVLGLIEEASHAHPVVVILDDLHWADRNTLALLKHLVVADPALRVLMIGTYRESDLSKDHPLSELLADLRREQGVERLALRGLEGPDVLAIMEAAAGHDMDTAGVELAHDILGETNGNPFYVAELLRHLSESGAIYLGEDGRWALRGSLKELGIPQSVREVVGRRVERLGGAASKALAVAAVIGREFDVELLVRVGDQTEDELIDLLDEAVEASVLVESSEVTGRYAFAHALVNHTLYEGLGRTRRARLHRRVAEALEEICGDDPSPRLRELAFHWSQATAQIDIEKAVDYARQAASQALEELAPDEALRLFTQALELQGQQPDAHPVDRCELLVGLGEAQRQAGEPAFRETLLEAGGLARELGEAELLAEAALRNGRGFGSSRYGLVDEERVATIEAALATVSPDDDRTRAKLLSKLALERNWDGDLAGRSALVDQAVELARGADDQRTLATVLGDASLAIWVPWTLPTRTEWSRELVELADRLGDPYVAARAAWIGVIVAVEGADREGLERHLDRASAIAEALGQPTLRWFAVYQRAAAHLLYGELEESERVAGEAAQAGAESGQPDAFTVAGAQILGVRFHQGRAAEVVSLVEQAAEQNPGISSFPATRAFFLQAADRADESAALLAEASKHDFEDVPEDQIWVSTMLLWADTAVVTRSLGACETLYRRLEPFADHVPWTGAGGYPPLANYLGMLARALGRFDVAERHFARAVEIEQRMGFEVFLARTRVEWAESILMSERPDAQEAAGPLLDAALETATARGAGGIERRVASLRLEGALSP